MEAAEELVLKMEQQDKGKDAMDFEFTTTDTFKFQD